MRSLTCAVGALGVCSAFLAPSTSPPLATPAARERRRLLPPALRAVGDATSAVAVDSLGALTVVALKDRCREAGLPVSGRKAELIERLSSHLEAAPATAEGPAATETSGVLGAAAASASASEPDSPEAPPSLEESLLEALPDEAEAAEGKNHESQHPGVRWSKAHEMWGAKVKMNGKQRHIGLFKEADEAWEVTKPLEQRAARTTLIETCTLT